LGALTAAGAHSHGPHLHRDPHGLDWGTTWPDAAYPPASHIDSGGKVTERVRRHGRRYGPAPSWTVPNDPQWRVFPAFCQCRQLASRDFEGGGRPEGRRACLCPQRPWRQVLTSSTSDNPPTPTGGTSSQGHAASRGRHRSKGTVGPGSDQKTLSRRQLPAGARFRRCRANGKRVKGGALANVSRSPQGVGRDLACCAVARVHEVRRRQRPGWPDTWGMRDIQDHRRELARGRCCPCGRNGH